MPDHYSFYLANYVANYITKRCVNIMLEWIVDPQAWLALGTLTLLEIILGIDNIIFLSLIVAKLPRHQHAIARRLGLSAAMLMRLGLLASVAWVISLTEPLFHLVGHAVSARDLILSLGGLFLIWKASKEIHEAIEGSAAVQSSNASSFFSAISKCSNEVQGF